jgi:DNA-binding HxlR family transcriptional regulator
MWTALLFGGLGFLLYLACVVIMLRIACAAGPSRIVIGAAVIVGIVTVVGALVVRPVILFWPLFASYSLLSLTFLLVFGAVYKSISLRILGDLLQRPERSDDYQRILARYIEEESYRARLSLLVSEGLAEREDARFRLTPKGGRLAKAVSNLQRFFVIRSSG